MKLSEAQPLKLSQIQPEQSGIYKGLTQETIKMIEQRVPDIPKSMGSMMAPNAPMISGGIDKEVTGARRRLANLERIRLDNPYLANLIENMSGFETSLVGAGKNFQDVGQGLGRLFGLLDKDDALDTPEYKALQSVRSEADLGEAISEIALFAVPAAKLSKAPKALALAEGALAGIDASGEGKGAGESVLEGAVASGLAFAGGKLFNYGRPTKKQLEIKRALEENPRDPDLAKYLIVDGKPRATTSLKKAANQFGDKGNEVVAVIKNASKEDKSAVKNMINIIKAGKKDPLFKDVNRVGDVVGESLKRRVIHLRNLNMQAGKRIDNIARTQLKGKKVDLSNARSKFKSDMDDLRVHYDPVSGQVNFMDSALEGANAGASRNLITRLARRLRNQEMDASDVHFMKRLIDKEVAYGKSPSGMAGDIDDSIKALRANVNESIRDISPSYKNANLKYKDTIEALDNLQAAAGRSIDMESNKALAVAARRLTNNTQSRDKLLTSLIEIDDVLNKYDLKFKTDILTQNHVANALENRFKTQGATSLGGMGQRVASNASKSKAQLGMEAAGKAVDKVLGVSDEEALNSLLRILD